MKIWLPVALVATSFCGPVLANPAPLQDPGYDPSTQQRMQEIREQLRQLEHELNAMQRESRQGQRVQRRAFAIQGDRLPRVDRQRMMLRGADPVPQLRTFRYQPQGAGVPFGGNAPQVHVEVERLHGDSGAQPRVRVQRMGSMGAPHTMHTESKHEARDFFLGGPGGEHASAAPQMSWHSSDKGAPKVEVRTEAYFVGPDGGVIELDSGSPYAFFGTAPQAGGSAKSCDCSCECGDGDMSFGNIEWEVDEEFATSFGSFTGDAFEGTTENTFVFTSPHGLTHGELVELEVAEECELEEEVLIECEVGSEPVCEGETEELIVEYAFAGDAIEAMDAYALQDIMEEELDVELELLIAQLEEGAPGEAIIVHTRDMPLGGKAKGSVEDEIDAEIEALLIELEGSSSKSKGYKIHANAQDEIEVEIEALLAELEGTAPAAPKVKSGKVKPKQDALAQEIESILVELEAPAAPAAPKAAPAPAPAPKVSADKQRIAELEGEVEELRSLVDSLIKELNRQ